MIMTKKMLLSIFIIISAISTANLISAAGTDGIKLIINPKGRYISAPEGEPFNVSCEVRGEESKFSLIKWLNLEGTVISEGNPSVVKSENKLFLTFINPKIKDSGTYRCSAVYNNETKLGQDIFIDFYANQRIDGRKPEFLSNFYNYTSDEGERLKFSCFVQAGEKPITYSWYNQNGVDISEDSSMPIFFTNLGNQSVLTINGVKSEHEGAYTCSARNKYGIANKVFSLKVYTGKGMKPEFDLTFENVTLVGGKRQYLKCLARGEKPVTYSWYNQEEDKISEDDRHSIYATHFEDYSLLNFEELKVEHEGTYTCTASNTHGLGSKVYLLRVINPTVDNDTDTDNGTSQFGFAEVVSLTARSVHFYINTTGSAKYIEVKYKESRSASSQTKRYSLTPVNLYKIGNLLPSGKYTFQFRTVPPENGNWSREQEVMLLPDVPEIIFQKIDSESVRLQWFRKSDDALRSTIDKYQIKYFSVQMVGGNSWTSRNCTVTIEIPTCVGSKYTISGLYQKVFYQIEVRAHTEAGYGEPIRQKIYLSD